MEKLLWVNEKSNFIELKVDAYLLSALNGSPKDRLFILRVESQVLALFRGLVQEVSFEELNSYFRMLVHRVARYYDLERTADSMLRTITVWAPPRGQQRPLLKLADMVEPAFTTPPERDSLSPANRPAQCATKKITIMKRAESTPRIEADLTDALTQGPTRTLEERERAYEEAKQRIFKSFQALELAGPSEEAYPSPLTAPDADEFSERTSSSTRVAVEEEDVIHFGGWRDIDNIKPFIPEAPSSPDEGALSAPPVQSFDEATFDFDSVWVPQHIFVARGAPTDETGLKLFKGKCKRRNCKYYGSPEGKSGILLFTYKVGDTEEQLRSRFGVAVEAWRPAFLPEPATL